MHLENEASVLDSRRSDICIFRGQKMRGHHSLWVIFWSVKKKKSCPAFNSLAYFLLEPVSWKVPAWEDFGKPILNRCAAVHRYLLNGLNVPLVLKIQRQQVLTADIFLSKHRKAFMYTFLSKISLLDASFAYPLVAPAIRWKYQTKISLNYSTEWFWVMASKGKKYFTHQFSSISFAIWNICSRWDLKMT